MDQNLEEIIYGIGDGGVVEVISSIFVQRTLKKKDLYFGIVHIAEHIENYSAATLDEALIKQTIILHKNFNLKEIK